MNAEEIFVAVKWLEYRRTQASLHVVTRRRGWRAPAGTALRALHDARADVTEVRS